jgi:tRNA A-37 threonylcarbamoyl transferase component Bud32
LRVPTALGFFEGEGVAVVAMERVESHADLRQVLHEAATSELEPLIARLLKLVIALHTRGWYHRDLYLHHILIDSDGDFVLIDLGRARCSRWVRRRWFAKDLAALLLWAPEEVSANLRLRFLAKYMDAMEIDGRRARRRFASDILRRKERMARHQPRHGETEPWGPSL